MRRDDHESFGDDDELLAYVAAFRTVEQPSHAARGETWTRIASETRTRRPWLWIGAVAAVAAALLLWLASERLRTALVGGADDDPRVDQAGYMHVGDAEVEDAEVQRRKPTRATPSEPEIEAPVIAPPVIEPSVVIEDVEPESAPTKAVRGKPRPGRSEPSLAEETALFGEIQQALVAGKPSQALPAIARHEREFPRGAFRQERVVAKAQALCALGKRARAVEVRDGFLARNPSSHLAPRMRAVCRE